MFDFASVREVRLSAGKHESPVEGMCLMEMVAWFAGEPHSDAPECACPVLAAFGMGINDCIDDETRDRLLKPLVGQLVGTRGSLEDQARRADFLAAQARPLLMLPPGEWKWQGDPATKAEAEAFAQSLRDSAMESATLTAQFCVELAGWSYAIDTIREAILLGANQQAFPEALARQRHDALRETVASAR